MPAVVVAREIVGTAVRNGGFAPLLLDPVDFVALYRQSVTATQAEQAVTPQLECEFFGVVLRENARR